MDLLDKEKSRPEGQEGPPPRHAEGGLYRLLFSPIDLGPVRIKNRIVMAPLTSRYPDDDGFVTDVQVDFYAARARGGTGLILVEGASVSPEGRGWSRHLLAEDDLHVPGLRRIATAIKENGARAFLQIMHCGRQTKREVSNLEQIAPSAIACPRFREVPREATLNDIERLRDDFVQAARRGYEAGFEGVELHAAHGYLLSGFLSPDSNKRTDRYGGSTENRARFLLEVIEGIQSLLGRDYPISVRVSVEEYVPGGLHVDESQLIARILEDAGVAALHASATVYGSYPAWVGSMPAGTGFGHFLEWSEGLKSAVSIPVIAVGRIVEPGQAEQVLARGQADMVALGRALIADPAWANNAVAGRVIPCIGCNACNARSRRPQIVCVNNPATGREAEFPNVLASERKHVLVLGGGLAALVAADYAARRGHEVRLWSAAGEGKPLGGLLELRSRVPGLGELHKSLEYFRDELSRNGVPVEEATRGAGLVEQVRAFEPDLVVTAERGEAKLPQVQDAQPVDFTPAGCVLAGDVTPRRAVVIGGNLMGADTALYLAERGSQVWLVEEGSDIALNAHPSVRYWHLQALRKSEVTFLPNTRVVRKDGGTVHLHNLEGEMRLKDIDALVVSLGFESWAVPAQLAADGLPVVDIGDTYDASDLSELTYRAARVVYDL